jgi:hypothetical protein
MVDTMFVDAMAQRYGACLIGQQCCAGMDDREWFASSGVKFDRVWARACQ